LYEQAVLVVKYLYEQAVLVVKYSSQDFWNNPVENSLPCLDMFVHILAYSISMMVVSLSVRYGMDSFTPQMFYPWKRSHMYPLNRRLGEPWSHSRCFGEEIS
jgi:hypothetical protein